MIYLEKPDGFDCRAEVASCFIECKGEVLFLLREDKKIQGNTWCLPAGKIEYGETPLAAVLREIHEETGLQFDKKTITHLQKVYVRFPDIDFIYHMFRTVIKNKKEIFLNPNEHKDFRWLTPKEAHGYPLIRDEDLCIKLVYPL